MKTITLFLYFVLTCLSVRSEEVQNQPVPNQPECLGINFVGSSWKYAVLFEPTGRYYLTCTHTYPSDGEVIVFANGETSIVKRTFHIRGGYDAGEYDLSIGELETPVSLKPAKVWWKLPDDFLIDENARISGFGFDGWFHGTKDFIEEENPSEKREGLWYVTDQVGVIRPGYSGAPVFYRGGLLGLNTIYRKSGSGGVVHLISMALEKYSNLLPEPFNPPTQPQICIKKVGEEMVITLKSPPTMDLCITSTPSMSTSPWVNIEECPGFLGYEEFTPMPWERVARFAVTANRCGFFRGEPVVASP